MNFDCEFHFEELKTKLSLIFFCNAVAFTDPRIGLDLSFTIFLFFFWFALLSYLLFFNARVSFLEFCQCWFSLLSSLNFSIFFENILHKRFFAVRQNLDQLRTHLLKFLFRFWCSVERNLKKSIIKISSFWSYLHRRLYFCVCLSVQQYLFRVSKTTSA